MTTYAMLCGINYYNTPNELRGCINDMLDMRSLLLSSGVEEKNITILSDAPDRRDIKPTSENILANLDRIGSIVKPGDTLIFHYSGHGTYSRDNNGDEADRKDEAICPINGTTITTISDDVFYGKIKSLPKDVKAFVVMDCCHSASNLDLQNNLDKRESNRVTDNQHGYVVAITGCQDNQTSADAYLQDKSLKGTDNRKQEKSPNQINNREIQVKDRAGTYRYRGALTAAFMDTVKKRKGLQAILDICFSNTKSLMSSLRADLLTWLQKNKFDQVPNIAYEGAAPKAVTATKREPLVEGFRVGRFNLRKTPARTEQQGYVPIKELSEHRPRPR